jgi:hypothetical protein
MLIGRDSRNRPMAFLYCLWVLLSIFRKHVEFRLLTIGDLPEQDPPECVDHCTRIYAVTPLPN